MNKPTKKDIAIYAASGLVLLGIGSTIGAVANTPTEHTSVSTPRVVSNNNGAELAKAKSDLADAKADLGIQRTRAYNCANAASLWKQAMTSETLSVRTYLTGMLSGAQLDLTEATDLVGQAKAAECDE